MRISDWSSDVCSSDLQTNALSRMQVSSTHTICARLSLTMVMFRLYTARIKAALRQTVAAISVVDGERQHCRELAPRAAAFSMPLVERSLHRSLVTLDRTRAV